MFAAWLRERLGPGDGEALHLIRVLDGPTLRARIVPPATVPAPELQLALDLAGAANDASGKSADASPRPRRLAWAALLVRVFAIDVTVCRKCGGRMRILEVVSDPDDIARALHGARPQPRPPRPNPDVNVNGATETFCW